MRGWEPHGQLFQQRLTYRQEASNDAYLSNDSEWDALERNSYEALAVMTSLAEYVGTHSIVAYPLIHVFDEVLLPECRRLSMQPIGQSGFCALALTQRLVEPLPAANFKLKTLAEYYKLPGHETNTVLGELKTLVDLFQRVLRPLAEERCLERWDEVCVFAEAPWFPSRIAFGPFKGQSFREAVSNQELYAWLETLAVSSNARIAEIGRWYLNQLSIRASSVVLEPQGLEVRQDDKNGILLYRNPELEAVRQLIADSRERLAELESRLIKEYNAVEVVRSQLFLMLRPNYERRDILQLRVQYLEKFLGTLLIEGETEASGVAKEHSEARTQCQSKYEEAAHEAAETKELSEEDQREMKAVHRKLATMYHPDRFAHDPEKREIYERLMQEINQARDSGNILLLRKIANNPDEFLLNLGMDILDLGEDDEVGKLRELFYALQERILNALANLDHLYDTDDYRLYMLSIDDPMVLQNVATQLSSSIGEEIVALEAQAARLSSEIESLIGISDPLVAVVG